MIISDSKVIKSFFDKNKDTTKNVMLSTIETNSGNNRTCQILFGIGIEVNPAKDTKIIAVPFGNSSSNLVGIGGYNPNIEPEIAQGGVKLFSTDATGQVLKSFINIINDGNIEINGKNDFAVRYNELETAYNQLKDDHDDLVTKFLAHIHTTTATVGAAATVGVISPTTTTDSPSTGDITNAKVDNVKLKAVGE